MSDIKLYNSFSTKDLMKGIPIENMICVGSIEDPYYYYTKWDKNDLSVDDCHLILHCDANRLELGVFRAP